MLQAGTLKHKVQLQSPTTSRDSYGGTTKTWTTVANTFADIAYISGKEYIVSSQLKAPVTARLTIRKRANVDATMRVLYGNTVFAIQSVLPDLELNEYLTLLCNTGAIDDGD